MPKAAAAVAAHFISKVLETAFFWKKVIILTFSFLKRGTKVSKNQNTNFLLI